MSNLPEHYTTAEVATAIKRSTRWVARQVKAGKVNPARTSDAVNAQYRFTAEDVQQLLASLRPAPVPARTRRKRRAS